MKKLEKYMKGFIDSINRDNNFKLVYKKQEEMSSIKRKEIQVLYNELVMYGKMKRNPLYLLDALLINFISYFNLSLQTLVNMKWNNFIVHTTGYSDKYYIHVPRII
jgi:hypothetical protein